MLYIQGVENIIKLSTKSTSNQVDVVNGRKCNKTK